MQTWDLLRALGFVEDPEAITDTPPGFSYRCDGLAVFATRGTNKWLRESIILIGHHNTGRTLAYIQSELPFEVEDLERLCELLRAVVSSREGLPWAAMGSSSNSN